ncbi:hypothetical protein Goshw_026046, partial [Gossypium schwendimanii]|nr:hypothetical protein [Gossypium schwendimanii]
ASEVAENAAKTIADIQAAKTIGLEHSAVNFADSMHHGGLPAGSVAPSLIKHYPAITPFYLIEEKLKEIQQIFTSDSGMDGNDLESAKGKTKDSHDEMKILHDSSIRKYADMAVGFINALAGLAVNDIIQRTTRRLESVLHSEGVHLVSQMCRLAVSHLLMLGKSVISSGNKVRVEDPDDDDGDDIMNIDWPEDPVEKAKLIRVKAQS